MMECLPISTWILMQGMHGLAYVYALDMCLVLFMDKLNLFINKKSKERKALPVRDAVPGVQLLRRQAQPSLKL